MAAVLTHPFRHRLAYACQPASLKDALHARAPSILQSPDAMERIEVGRRRFCRAANVLRDKAKARERHQAAQRAADRTYDD